jgi:hypothetical protein
VDQYGVIFGSKRISDEGFKGARLVRLPAGLILVVRARNFSEAGDARQIRFWVSF